MNDREKSLIELSLKLFDQKPGEASKDLFNAFARAVCELKMERMLNETFATPNRKLS